MKNKSASYIRYNNRDALKNSTATVRTPRDCSKLTMEQLVLLASVPGNADVVEELERRQAR